MTVVLNVLGALALIVLLVLRRWFGALIGGDRSHARKLRLMLGPAVVVLLAFLAAGIWMLIDAGYPFVALVVVAHVAILLDVAWRTPRHRRVE